MELSGYRGTSDSGEANQESVRLLDRLLKLVEERDWTAKEALITIMLYGTELPPRGIEILDLYTRPADTESHMAEEDEQKTAAQLRNVVMLEKASVPLAQTIFRVRRLDFVRGSLGSSWVPTTENWDLLVAEEAHLDRMIESKIRLLIRLQGLEKGGKQATVCGRQSASENDKIPVEAILHHDPAPTLETQVGPDRDSNGAGQVAAGGGGSDYKCDNARKTQLAKLNVNLFQNQPKHMQNVCLIAYFALRTFS